MTQTNRQLRLRARPEGRIRESDFDLVSEPAPQPGPGEALVRTLFLSLDPTNRVWMTDVPQYLPPVEIGAVMRGAGVGEVVASNRDDMSPGDLLYGMTGWQDYSIAGADAIAFQKLPSGLPVSPSIFLGTLGATGLTAYFGLLEIGQPKAGETVVVSAAAGAVGSVVGQLAKIQGCRVVGLAGTPEKCAWLTDDLGFDAAINYKASDWRDQLGAACPDGVDIDFENVGGEIMEAVIDLLNLNARIVLCGLISQYNESGGWTGPRNFTTILHKRLRIQGFIILDYLPRAQEGIAQLGQWMMEGKLKDRETVVEGLEQAPVAINQLFDGGNTGKLVVKVADPGTG